MQLQRSTGSQKVMQKAKYLRNTCKRILFANVYFSAMRLSVDYRTSSYNDNKENYALDSLLPDFKFVCKISGKNFHVEAKFRRDNCWENDKLIWIYPNQLNCYRQVDAQ